MPALAAASREVDKRGRHVNRALALELTNWWVSSETEEVGLASDTIPDRRCVAHARGNVSIYCRSVVDEKRLLYRTSTYRIHAEDAYDLVPLGAVAGLPAELFRQGTSQEVDTVNYLVRRIGLPRDSTSEGV
jgi:hypothetical protein